MGYHQALQDIIEDQVGMAKVLKLLNILRLRLEILHSFHVHVG